MIIDIFDDCCEDDKYENGVNITLHRCIPDNDISIKFEDDGGTELFRASLKWTDFRDMVKRLED